MPVNLDKLSERVSVIQRDVGGSVGLESISGVKLTQQSRIIRKEISSPGINQLLALSEAGNVSVDWLIGNDRFEQLGEMVLLPVFDPTTGDFVSDDCPISFARQYLQTLCNPENAFLYQELTDSMTNTVLPGNWLVMEKTDQVEGVALVNVYDQYVLRRLQRISSIETQLICDNKIYETQIFKNSEFNVIGFLARRLDNG